MRHDMTARREVEEAHSAIERLLDYDGLPVADRLERLAEASALLVGLRGRYRCDRPAYRDSLDVLRDLSEKVNLELGAHQEEISSRFIAAARQERACREAKERMRTMLVAMAGDAEHRRLDCVHGYVMITHSKQLRIRDSAALGARLRELNLFDEVAEVSKTRLSRLLDDRRRGAELLAQLRAYCEWERVPRVVPHPHAGGAPDEDAE